MRKHEIHAMGLEVARVYFFLSHLLRYRIFAAGWPLGRGLKYEILKMEGSRNQVIVRICPVRWPEGNVFLFRLIDGIDGWRVFEGNILLPDLLIRKCFRVEGIHCDLFVDYCDEHILTSEQDFPQLTEPMESTQATPESLPDVGGPPSDHDSASVD